MFVSLSLPIFQTEFWDYKLLACNKKELLLLVNDSILITSRVGLLFFKLNLILVQITPKGCYCTHCSSITKWGRIMDCFFVCVLVIPSFYNICSTAWLEFLFIIVNFTNSFIDRHLFTISRRERKQFVKSKVGLLRSIQWLNSR